MFKHRLLLITLLISLFATQSILTAQQPIIITVTASEWQGDLYEDTIIPLFEAEHPNIQVEFVYNESTYFGDPLSEPEGDEPGYFENLQDFASSADVLYVDSFSLSSYGTATGLFLDLSPLISVDDSLQTDDFYNAAWQAFQWDGGHWALPYTVQVQLLVYEQGAFDTAGFPYPDQTWRMQDYIRAAEAMHTYNSDGKVELSPITALDPVRLFHNEIGLLYDPLTMPAQPDFENPELIDVLDTYMTYYSSYEFAEFRGYSFDEIPMSLNFPYQLSSNSFGPSSDKEWGISFLPGNLAGARVEGFAVSSGTLHPEAAYAFASFMTRNIDVFQFGFGNSPARRSLANVEPEDDNFFSRPEFEPEVQAIIDEALEVAIPPSDLRYAEVFYRVRTLVDSDDVSIEEALETVQLDIIEGLEQAQAQQSTQIMVEPPELRPELASDEIVLTFGMNMSTNVNATQQLWDDLIREFAATHPRVGDIDLDTQIYGPDGLDEDVDCWYNSFGGAFSSLTEPPQEMLALDPFLSADPEFDRSDFLPGILEGAQVQNMMYGYPLTVQPMVMRLNVAKFEEAGLSIPDGSWTVNDFTNALVALGELRENTETPVLRSNQFGSTWVTMLIGSYGGQPFDFSTDPPTYPLTDPQNITAIEQFVRYAKDGLISYNSMIDNNSTFFGGLPEDDFITIEVLGEPGFGGGGFGPGVDEVETQVVLFPDGTYLPIAFSSGMAHISSNSVNIQECYDWIQTISRHPELFTGMPASPSQFENPALIAQHGEDVVDFYKSMSDDMTAPNILPFSNIYGGVPSTRQGAWIVPDFFFYALDNIILNDADIETELAQAEANINAYNECSDGIEKISQQEMSDLFEQDQAEGLKYLSQFSDCAITLVPELRDRYQFYYRED